MSRYQPLLGDYHAQVRRLLPPDWRIDQHNVWWGCAYEGAQIPAQGWKIHLSATPAHSPAILMTVARMMIERRVTFKFLVDRTLLHLSNGKRWSRGAAGKFITVYPTSTEHCAELLEDLHRATVDYWGPYILSDRRYKDSRIVHYRYMLDRLRALPGVQRVAVTGNLPLGSQLNLPATLDDGRSIQPQYRPVDGDYFALFAIASSAGRVFDARDSHGADPVCMVSAAFASAYLKGDPLGQTLRMGRGDGNAMPTMRVVGVVGDVRQFGPAEPAPPIVYVPLAQMPPKLWNTMREFGPLNYVVRTRGQIANLEPALRKAVAEAAPRQPIGDIRSMRSVVDEAVGESRLQLLLVGLFSLLALSLACIGLYAVLSVNVAARRHECGVRAALGASARRLLALVFRDSAVQVAIGLGAGLIAALLAARVIRRFLFGVGAADPLAVAVAVALVLALAATVATALPALRVARSDPMQALRVD